MRRRLFNVLTAMSLLLCVAVVLLWVRSYWVGESFTFNPRIEWRTPDPSDDRPWFEGWRRYWSVGSSRGRLIISHFEYAYLPRQEAERAASMAARQREMDENDKRMDELFRRMGRPPRPPRAAPFRPPQRGQLIGYDRSVPQFAPINSPNPPPVVTRYEVPWLIEFAKLERRVPPPGASGLLDGGKLFVSLPSLVPALAFSLLPLVWTTRRLRRLRMARRAARGSCPTCGYSLTGNVSGVCPECGSGRGHDDEQVGTTHDRDGGRDLGHPSRDDFEEN